MSAPDLGPAVCGSLGNSYGPLDYRTATDEQHILVEGAHFTPQVESLQRGKTAATAGPDIDYTLRVFPNHHRALLSMMNLGLKEKTHKPLGSRYVIECWLERGERWRPDDGVVKMLYGVYLLRSDRREEAVKKLEEAEKLVETDPNVYYNLGLAFMQLGRYDRALEYAHKAYALNYPLPGLRDKLKKAGRWREPPPTAANSAPQSQASAAD